VVALASLALTLWRPGTGVTGWTTGLLLGAAGTALAMTAAAGSPRRLIAVLKPGPAAEWRPVGPLARRRFIDGVRDAEPVREVLSQLPGEPRWRRAEVRVTGRPVRISRLLLTEDGYRLQIVKPDRGTLAVVAFTPKGMITPRRAPVPAGPLPAPPPKPVTV